MKRSKKFVAALLGVVTIGGALGIVPLSGTYADEATGQSIHIDGSEATDTYTNTTSVDVDVTALHCPSGGTMQDLTVSLSNDNTTFTVVKASGIAWPGGTDPDGCPIGGNGTNSAQTGTFAWTLAAGADGIRTVYMRLTHGNDVVTGSDTITLDTVAPVITAGAVTGTANAAGWYSAAISVAFSATDTGGSGVACSPNPWSVGSGTSEGDTVQVPSGACADVAGNNNTGINAGPYKIDLSDPSVAITAPATGHSTSDATVSVSGTVSDTISGVKGVTVNTVAATLGTGTGAGTFAATVPLDCGANSISATATDNADRTATSSSISVTRTCGSTLTGTFGQPIDGNGVVNKGKIGRVIPVKLEVWDGATEVENGTPIPTVSAVPTGCNTSANSDTIETYAAGSSNSGFDFRWDTTGGHWIYNLDTSKLPGATANKCFTVTASVGGTSIASFLIQLTK